jgi:hypothetical protein
MTLAMLRLKGGIAGVRVPIGWPNRLLVAVYVLWTMTVASCRPAAIRALFWRVDSVKGLIYRELSPCSSLELLPFESPSRLADYRDGRPEDWPRLGIFISCESKPQKEIRFKACAKTSRDRQAAFSPTPS